MKNLTYTIPFNYDELFESLTETVFDELSTFTKEYITDNFVTTLISTSSEFISSFEYIENEMSKFHNGVVLVDSNSYFIGLSSIGKIIEMDSDQLSNVTIPENSNISIPVDSYIHIVQFGDGATRLIGESGVTIMGVRDLVDRYRGLTLYKLEDNIWLSTYFINI